MKEWKQKVNVPKYGLCTVRELTDRECRKKSSTHLAAASHGFVNLYVEDKHVAWCGWYYAKDLLQQQSQQ